MLFVKPITSELKPLRVILLFSCVTFMTFTAPMATASGDIESRKGITFSL